ncbi:hypothetical protein ACLOJK_028232 [Asimina triloba]
MPSKKACEEEKPERRLMLPGLLRDWIAQRRKKTKSTFDFTLPKSAYTSLEMMNKQRERDEDSWEALLKLGIESADGEEEKLRSGNASLIFIKSPNSPIAQEEREAAESCMRT